MFEILYLDFCILIDGNIKKNNIRNISARQPVEWCNYS